MNSTDFLNALDERSHFRPGTVCPRCQTPLDRATGIAADSAPRPGDLSICVFCEALLQYQADLSFRLMSDSEVAALPEEVLLSLLNGIEGARMLRKALDADA